MNKTAIYARKSTESEDKQVQSIDSQIKELKSYAARLGWRVDYIFTESKSAKAPGRPVFNELYNLVQKGIVREILCWKLDRLARNPVDGGAVIWAMEEGNLLNIHTPQRTFCNSGNDKFWLQLEFGMAKKYVDDLRDNVKRGIKTKFERGWYPHRPPIGYLNDRDNKTIIEDPDRYPIIRKMWNLMLTEQYTPERILEIATDKWGLRNRLVRSGGGKPMIRSAAYKLFKNPFYYGMMNHNGNLYRGNHKAMISRSEFDAVQEILNGRNKKKGYKHNFKYTGLIKCGECGSMITAEHKTNRFGTKYIYYRCTKKKRNLRCFQKYIEEKELERQIISFLDSITINKRLLAWALDNLKYSHTDVLKEKEIITRSLQKRLTLLRNASSELVNLKLRGLLTDQEFLFKKAELEKESSELKIQLSNAKNDDSHVIEKCRDFFNFAASAKSTFLNGSENDKRAVIRSLGSNLVLLDKKLVVYVQKPLIAIQNELNGQPSENQWVEPGNKNEPQRKSEVENAVRLSWYSLVDEVRTYYTKSMGFPQSGGSYDTLSLFSNK